MLLIGSLPQSPMPPVRLPTNLTRPSIQSCPLFFFWCTVGRLSIQNLDQDLSASPILTMSDPPSPEYHTILASLLAKAKRMKPLSPSATPHARHKRKGDYNMTTQVLTEVNQVMAATRQSEQISLDSDEPNQDDPEQEVDQVNPQLHAHFRPINPTFTAHKPPHRALHTNNPLLPP